MRVPTRISVGDGEAAVFSTCRPGSEPSRPNQDGAAVLAVAGGRMLLAVADGVGGAAAGERASALVLRALALAVADAAPDEPLRSRILDGLEQANREILDLALGAATTVALAEVDGASLRPYHVGDSAVLVVGGRGRIKLQTVAHSPVGYGVEAGLLDEDEALHHEARHVISNAVGASDMRIEVGSPVPLAARDTVLLATDGLLDNLGVAEIVAYARRHPLGKAASALADEASTRMQTPEATTPSKPDDLTFVLWRRGTPRKTAGGASSNRR